MIQLVALPPTEDEEVSLLIEDVKAGNDLAFAEIHRRMLPIARTSAKACLRNETDVEDVAHHAMLRLYSSLARFRGDCSLKTWTYKIARNLAINRSKKNKWLRKDVTISLDVCLEGFDEPLHAVIADESEGAREEIEREELDDRISAARLLLPETQQQIIALRVDLKLDYLEIADFLSMNVGTVKSRLARARGALRELLA